MDPKFFLVIMLLHAPIVFGCVKYHAQFHPGATGGDAEPLQMSLNDNGVDQCSYDGLPNQADQVSYGMTCVSGVSAVFNPNGNSNQGEIVYSPSWGVFNIATSFTPPHDDEDGAYDASVYGC